MSRLLLLLRTADPRIVGLYNAVFAVFWGAWLLLPFRTFNVAPVYHTMSSIAPEWVWGMAYLGIGLFHVRAVLNRNSRWCKSFSYVAVFIWILLSAMYAHGDYRGLGVIVYALIALSAVWVCIRLGMMEVVGRQESAP